MKRSRSVRSSYLRLAAAALPAVLLPAWFACKAYRIDSHCTPDTPSYKEDPACIYNGTDELPPWNEGECGADAGTPTPPTTCPTNAAVFAFLTDKSKGNCTAGACHGSITNPAAGIFLNPDKPDEFYQTLTQVTGSVGTPYVVPGGEAYKKSWILCSLTAQAGGGYPMPPASGVPNHADASIISDWLLCGASGLQ